MQNHTAVSTRTQSPVINRIDIDADTLRLWRHLWRGGASYFWRAWMEGDKQYSESQWFTVDEIPTTLATQHGDNWYFGVHPTSAKRSEKQRSRNVDIAAINCLFGEFDVKDYSGDWTALRQHVYTLPAPPTCVINSGGGAHCYWLLETTITISDDAGRQAVRNLQNRWCDFVGGDKNAKDIARILRIPGTQNYKPDYAPNHPTVQWEHTDWQRLYSLADIAGVLPTQSTSATPAPSMPVAGGGDLVQRWVAMDLATLATASNGNRNDQLNRTAFRLGQWIPHEMARSDAERQLLAVAQSIGLSAGEAQRTIRSGLDAGAKSARQVMRRSAPTPAPADDGAEYDGFGPMPDDELPAPTRFEIDVDRQHYLVADDCLEALCHANDADPRYPAVFISSGMLAMVAGDDDADAQIVPLDVDTLAHQVARRADFISWRKNKDGEMVRVNRLAPRQHLAGVLKSRQWPGLPRLDSIVRAPQFAPDGTLRMAHGYDSITKKWIDADDIAIGDTTPTPATVAAARDLVLWWLQDFPFADDASRTHAIALLLQPWLMAWIPDGKSPMWTITASTAGSGKTLLGQLASYVYTGQWPDIRTMPSDDDEMRKEIVSALVAKPATFFIDNMAGDVDSPVLAGALTAGKYGGRVLGASVNASGKTNWTWLATSNNPRISDELARRAVLIRLEPNCAAPEKRTDFAIDDILTWTEEHRAELVTACITMIRAWVADGMRLDHRAVKGSFTTWARVVGGVLRANGFAGFLANEETLRTASAPDREIWNGFFAAWWRKYRDNGHTAGELFGIASYTDAGGADLLGTLREMSSDKERGRRTQLGMLLQSKVGTVWTVPDGVGYDATDDAIAKAPRIDVVLRFVARDRTNAAIFQLTIAPPIGHGDRKTPSSAEPARNLAEGSAANYSSKPQKARNLAEPAVPIACDFDALLSTVDSAVADGGDAEKHVKRIEEGLQGSARFRADGDLLECSTAEPQSRFRATDDAATIVAALLAGETVSPADERRWNAAHSAAQSMQYIVKRTIPATGGHRFVLERIASASTIATELGL